VIATPDAVFAVVADIASHHTLAGSGEVLAISRPPDHGWEIGSTFGADEAIRIGPFTRRFTATSEITEFDPPHVLAWTSTPDTGPKPRRIQWWFRITPDPLAGTRLLHEVEVEFGGAVLNRVVGPIYGLLRGRAIARGMSSTVRNVAGRAEEQPHSGGAAWNRRPR
jgi:hypothetical protein